MDRKYETPPLLFLLFVFATGQLLSKISHHEMLVIFFQGPNLYMTLLSYEGERDSSSYSVNNETRGDEQLKELLFPD